MPRAWAFYYTLFLAEDGVQATRNYHDNGHARALKRKTLLPRNLFARFGPPSGICSFNLGEENDYGTAKREQFCRRTSSRLTRMIIRSTTHTKQQTSTKAFYKPTAWQRETSILPASRVKQTAGCRWADLIADWRISFPLRQGAPWGHQFSTKPQKIEKRQKPT